MTGRPLGLVEPAWPGLWRKAFSYTVTYGIWVQRVKQFYEVFLVFFVGGGREGYLAKAPEGEALSILK